MEKEESIEKQVKAMLAWSIDVYHEVQDGKNLSGILKLARAINTQGRKLEYRGRGLKKLPKIPDVEELKKHITSARAGAKAVIDNITRAKRIKEGRDKLDVTDLIEKNAKGKVVRKKKKFSRLTSIKYEYKSKKLLAAAQKMAVSTMESMHEAAGIVEKKPWDTAPALVRKENCIAFVDLLYKRGYYSGLSLDQQKKWLYEALKDNATVYLENFDLRKCNFKFELPTEFNSGKAPTFIVSESNLKEADFSGATLFLRAIGTDFTKANFNRAKISNSVKESDFTNSTWKNATMKNATCQNANFKGAKFQGADLTGTRFDSSRFDGVDFRSANITEAYFKRCTFIKGNLGGMDFSKKDLTYAKFNNAKLSNSVFENATLNQAKFDGATAIEANFVSVLCKYSAFDNANLRGSNLTKALLTYSTCINTIFRECNLQSAILKGVNVEGADFTNANLFEASLSEIKNLTKEQLTSAKNWWTATNLPEEFDEIVKKAQARMGGRLSLAAGEAGALSLADLEEGEEVEKGFWSKLRGK